MKNVTDTLVGLIRAGALPERVLFALYSDPQTPEIIKQDLSERHPEFARSNREWIKVLEEGVVLLRVSKPQEDSQATVIYTERLDHIRAELHGPEHGRGYHVWPLFHWRPFHWIVPLENRADPQVTKHLWHTWAEATDGLIERDLDRCPVPEEHRSKRGRRGHGPQFVPLIPLTEANNDPHPPYGSEQ